MDATWINVVDTIVKVGLGASISGFCAYLMGSSNQRHDLNKAVLDQKCKLICDLVEHLEKATTLINVAKVPIEQHQKRNLPRNDQILEDAITNLRQAFDLVRIAHSYALLSGDQRLALIIERYLNEVESIYHAYAGWNFGDKELNDHPEKRIEIKNETHKHLKNRLEELYRD